MVKEFGMCDNIGPRNLSQQENAMSMRMSGQMAGLGEELQRKADKEIDKILDF